MEITAIISAVSAFAALMLSIFIYNKTRKLLKPKERPIITITPKITKASFSKNKEKMIVKVEMMVEFVFKNVGIHPANNFNFILGAAYKGDLGSFKIHENRNIANRIENEGIYPFWQTIGKEIPVDEKSIELDKMLIANGEEIYYYALVTYEDFYFPKNKYTDEFWYRFTMGKEAIISLTTLEKKSLEPYVRKVINK
jgi:hypothetical protein